MLKKAALVVVAAIVIFAVYVGTRPSHFRYERSGVINAGPEKIYPYLSQFQLGKQWSPYEHIDPQMKETISSNDGQVGATMEFEGNSNVGAGKLEILKMTPNQSVTIKLTMLKPFYGENTIEYKLAPEVGGTRFTWSMSGDGGFLGKLISIFIDCEKMVGDQFDQGIANLKSVVESKK